MVVIHLEFQLFGRLRITSTKEPISKQQKSQNTKYKDRK
jgi:hypothetical protein